MAASPDAIRDSTTMTVSVPSESATPNAAATASAINRLPTALTATMYVAPNRDDTIFSMVPDRAHATADVRAKISPTTSRLRRREDRRCVRTASTGWRAGFREETTCAGA